MANFPNAPQNLSLESFRASLDQMGGVAKAARFVVQIQPIGADNALNQKYSNNLTNLMYACFAVDIPGRGFDVFSTRYYGPKQDLPFNSEYDDAVSLSLICRNGTGPNGFSERAFFDDWQDLINPTTTFNFAYPSTYFCDVRILQFSEHANNEKTGGSKLNYGWTLRKAWPAAVKPRPVTWMDTDFLYIDVALKFRYWDRSDEYGREDNLGYTQQRAATPILPSQ